MIKTEVSVHCEENEDLGRFQNIVNNGVLAKGPFKNVINNGVLARRAVYFLKGFLGSPGTSFLNNCKGSGETLGDHLKPLWLPFGALYFALGAPGVHLAAQGLYLAAPGLYLAAQGLYLAAQGLYLAAQGKHLVTKGRPGASGRRFE